MNPFHSQLSSRKLQEAEERRAARDRPPIYFTWENSNGETFMIAGPGLNWHRMSQDEELPAIPTTGELAEMEAAGFDSVLDLRSAKAAKTPQTPQS